MLPLVGLPMSFLAYALIWAFFLAIPIARGVVSAQFGRLPSAMGRRLWLGMICGSALVPVNGLLLVLLGTHTRAEKWGADAAALFLNLGWAITVATTEEMIVRGLLLTRLRQLTGDVAAIALTAVVFAGMHVGRAPGGHGWRPDLADLAAYAVVIPLCLALFRVSPLQTGKP